MVVAVTVDTIIRRGHGRQGIPDCIITVAAVVTVAVALSVAAAVEEVIAVCRVSDLRCK